MAPRIDYGRVERDWRAGIKTPQQLAEDYYEQTGHAVSRQALEKGFKAKGIERDLTEKIKAKAKAKVAKQSCVQSCTHDDATEKQIIESNSDDLAAVQMGQRRDIQKYRATANTVWKKLDDSLKGVGEELSFPVQVDLLKKLSDTVKTLIAVESAVYGIGEEQEDKKGYFVQLAPGDELL